MSITQTETASPHIVVALDKITAMELKEASVGIKKIFVHVTCLWSVLSHIASDAYSECTFKSSMRCEEAARFARINTVVSAVAALLLSAYQSSCKCLANFWQRFLLFSDVVYSPI